jgi:hypothetical protein
MQTYPFLFFASVYDTIINLLKKSLRAFINLGNLDKIGKQSIAQIDYAISPFGQQIHMDAVFFYSQNTHLNAFQRPFIFLKKIGGILLTQILRFQLIFYLITHQPILANYYTNIPELTFLFGGVYCICTNFSHALYQICRVYDELSTLSYLTFLAKFDDVISFFLTGVFYIFPLKGASFLYCYLLRKMLGTLCFFCIIIGSYMIYRKPVDEKTINFNRTFYIGRGLRDSRIIWVLDNSKIILLNLIATNFFTDSFAIAKFNLIAATFDGLGRKLTSLLASKKIQGDIVENQFFTEILKQKKNLFMLFIINSIPLIQTFHSFYKEDWAIFFSWKAIFIPVIRGMKWIRLYLIKIQPIQLTLYRPQISVIKTFLLARLFIGPNYLAVLSPALKLILRTFYLPSEVLFLNKLGKNPN